MKRLKTVWVCPRSPCLNYVFRTNAQKNIWCRALGSPLNRQRGHPSFLLPLPPLPLLPMRQPLQSTLAHFVPASNSSSEGPSGGVRMRPPTVLAHPITRFVVLWTHRQLYRRPQWRCWHCPLAHVVRHTPHTLRGHTGSFTEGPGVGVRKWNVRPLYCGTPPSHAS